MYFACRPTDENAVFIYFVSKRFLPSINSKFSTSVPILIEFSYERHNSKLDQKIAFHFTSSYTSMDQNGP